MPANSRVLRPKKPLFWPIAAALLTLGLLVIVRFLAWVFNAPKINKKRVGFWDFYRKLFEPKLPDLPSPEEPSAITVPAPTPPSSSATPPAKTFLVPLGYESNCCFIDSALQMLAIHPNIENILNQAKEMSAYRKDFIRANRPILKKEREELTQKNKNIKKLSPEEQHAFRLELRRHNEEIRSLNQYLLTEKLIELLDAITQEIKSDDGVQEFSSTSNISKLKTAFRTLYNPNSVQLDSSEAIVQFLDFLNAGSNDFEFYKENQYTQQVFNGKIHERKTTSRKEALPSLNLKSDTDSVFDIFSAKTETVKMRHTDIEPKPEDFGNRDDYDDQITHLNIPNTVLTKIIVNTDKPLDFFYINTNADTYAYAQSCLHSVISWASKNNAEDDHDAIEQKKQISQAATAVYQNLMDKFKEHVNTESFPPLIKIKMGYEQNGHLQEREETYVLAAVSAHSGGYHAGHYTTNIREGNEWYHFNDVSPTEKSIIPQEECLSSGGEARVLAYMRQEVFEKRYGIKINETPAVNCPHHSRHLREFEESLNEFCINLGQRNDAWIDNLYMTKVILDQMESHEETESAISISTPAPRHDSDDEHSEETEESGYNQSPQDSQPSTPTRAPSSPLNSRPVSPVHTPPPSSPDKKQLKDAGDLIPHQPAVVHSQVQSNTLDSEKTKKSEGGHPSEEPPRPATPSAGQ